MDTNGHTFLCEDYVSFETAKLLKEKGFDVETRGYYPIKGDATGRLFANSSSEYNHNHSQVQISAPTIQMAMKWLREAHRIFIRIIQSHIDYCCFEVYWNRGDYYKPMTFCNSYEEACEAAIRYCLENLI